MFNEKYNYLTIDTAELPSRGLLYPSDTRIRGRFLTIQDVKFLALITDNTASMIINEILDRCFDIHGIELKDILLCDRQYMIFWLRANSFMKENGYKIHIRECNHCHHSFEDSIKLDDIPIKYLEEIPRPIRLPKCGTIVKLKMPTIADTKIIDEDPDVQKAARMIDVENPVNFILHLGAYDFMYLLQAIEKYDVGFNMVFDMECSNCHSMNKVSCLLKDETLFGQTDMREIISQIVHITKYLTYKISDDIAWPEFEMIGDITNKMIKEENDEMAKQEAKAKAQASSAKSSAMMHSRSNYHH